MGTADEAMRVDWEVRSCLHSLDWGVRLRCTCVRRAEVQHERLAFISSAATVSSYPVQTLGRFKPSKEVEVSCWNFHMSIGLAGRAQPWAYVK